jgi:hypothetical protein
MTKTEIEIAKTAFEMVKSINQQINELYEKHDEEFADQVYNGVALTLITKICIALCEQNGHAAFESYWSDVDSKMRGMIKAFACTPTKH